MQSSNLIRWMLGSVLGAALLLPVGLAAQDTGDQSDDPTATEQTDRQNRHRKLHQKAQERFAQARERLQADRQAYRQTVDEFGKDSPQAREAKAKLRKDKQRLKQAKKRFAKRDGQLHRRRAQRNSGQARPGAQGRRRARTAGGRARGPGRNR